MPRETFNTPSPFWKRGAGIIVAIAVILLFILAATFLRSLAAGVLLAYLFLPLQKFFEKLYLGRKPGKEKKLIHINLAIGTVLLSITVGILLLLGLLTTFLLPGARNTGEKLRTFAAKIELTEKLDHALTPYLPEQDEKEGNKVTPLPSGKEKRFLRQDSGKDFSTHIRKELLPKLRSYIRENFQLFSSHGLQAGKIAVHTLSSLISKVSHFLLDLLLAIFFFLYFLQKMALFTDSFTPEKENGKKSSPGIWVVDGIFSTNWLPDVSERTKWEAACVIDRICNMFQKWVRGYFAIIVLESFLYILLFYLFSVPYALLLGLLAGLTILLPFLGPLASIILTVGVTLAFSDGNTAFTLAGVLLTYGIINGLLEQFYLYPRLVGGAIGLTTLETIIVVLLGGIFAGVGGMILAVPAAAVLKMLIPEIYRICRR